MAGMKSDNSKMKVPYARVPSFFMLFSIIPFANFYQFLRHLFFDAFRGNDGHIIAKAEHPTVELLADCHRNAYSFLCIA